MVDKLKPGDIVALSNALRAFEFRGDPNVIMTYAPDHPAQGSDQHSLFGSRVGIYLGKTELPSLDMPHINMLLMGPWDFFLFGETIVFINEWFVHKLDE